MAAKKATGISPSTVRFGPGIAAVRALPKAKGKRPAVIILHERYGIDHHTKDLTVKLAQTGFLGLAPDLFHRFTGDRKALQKGQARVDLRDDEALEDLNAAVDYLKELNNVDEARIGIIGVCHSIAGISRPLITMGASFSRKGAGRLSMQGETDE